jgi:oxygen-dependent protoporphyrinogen oxidase
VFAAIDGGMSRLVDSLADAVRAAGGRIRLDTTVRELDRGSSGWRVTSGSTRDAAVDEFDAVVLAVPAHPAARLLATVVDRDKLDPWAALDYASVALITLALPGLTLPDLSGFLVPATSGYAIKAATFFSQKWPGYGDDIAVVRLSVGRYGDVAALQRPDDELVTLAHKELGDILHRDLPAPADTAVHRWGGALPQYRPGHLDRLKTLRAALPHTISIAGAGTDGIGIPACVRSGQTAAGRILSRLAESGI